MAAAPRIPHAHSGRPAYLRVIWAPCDGCRGTAQQAWVAVRAWVLGGGCAGARAPAPCAAAAACSSDVPPADGVGDGGRVGEVSDAGAQAGGGDRLLVLFAVDGGAPAGDLGPLAGVFDEQLLAGAGGDRADLVGERHDRQGGEVVGFAVELPRPAFERRDAHPLLV